MKKRKCDWCYFTDGTKKKITNWYQFDGDVGDILFFVEGKSYLYKKDGFGYEDLHVRTKQNLIFLIIPRGGFYIHRSSILHCSSDYFDTNNGDEWIITNVEKIELRK